MISEEDAARIRKAILALFHDDPQARDIVQGTMEEMIAEMCCVTGHRSSAASELRGQTKWHFAYFRGYRPGTKSN